MLLFEICNTRLKDLQILLSVNVNSNAIVTALTMSHLTKYTSVRTCNTLNVVIRTVNIPFLRLVKVPFRIYVTSSYLSVGKKLFDPLLICYKTPLTMGSRIAVHSAQISHLKPWGFIAYNLRINHLGNMSANGIVGQSR